MAQATYINNVSIDVPAARKEEIIIRPGLTVMDAIRVLEQEIEERAALVTQLKRILSR